MRFKVKNIEGATVVINTDDVKSYIRESYCRQTAIQSNPKGAGWIQAESKPVDEILIGATWMQLDSEASSEMWEAYSEDL